MNNKVILKMSMLREIDGRGEYEADEIYKSDNAIVAYTALRCLYDVKKTELKVTTKDLLNALGYDTSKRSDREKKNIVEGLTILSENDVISFERKGNSYIIDTTNLYVEMKRLGDLTFSIPLDFIAIIMQQKNSFALLHHYLLLCSTINVMGKHYGMASQEWFADKLEINKRTVITRHQLFVELGLIVFSEHRNAMDKNGDFINIPKLYTMPYCQKEIEELAEEQRNKTVKRTNQALKKIEKERKSVKKENAPFGVQTTVSTAVPRKITIKPSF